MRAILANRWVWVTALFATLNAAGLIGILSALRQRSGHLRVEAFEPEGECAPSATPTLRFNQLMALQEEVGAELPAGTVALRPPVPGRFVWSSRLAATFQPAEPLPMATPFTVTVSRKLTSLLGHSLPGDASFQFHTPPLRWVGVRQTGLSRWGELSLALEFTDKVLPDEARGHIELADAGGRAIGFDIGSRTPSRSVLLTARALPDETLTLTVKKGLRALSGPLGLEEDGSRTLRVEAGLRIEGVAARARTPDDVFIAVSCNQPLDAEAAVKCIQVEPKTDFRLQADYEGFRLAGPFAPGRRYRITFLKGLAARNGAGLAKDLVRSVVIPDVEPGLRFRTQGLYLASQGALSLPLESVNVRQAELSIEQVYPNNIVHYLRDASDALCRTVHKQKLAFALRPNERQVTDLDLRKLLGASARGLFRATVLTQDIRWGHPESHLFLVTDLALTVKRSESDLLVWVNTLSTAQPVAGATVAVLSRANQQVLSGTSDANGLAHFTGVNWSPDKQPYAVAATRGDDTGIVQVEETRLDDSDLDTGGRPYLADGYEAFVYSDRGIYRPGSQVFLRALVRDASQVPGQAFPVQFRIQRPDGRLYKTLAAKLNNWGSAEVALDVPSHALTGRYAVDLRLPGSEASLGSHTFQVEEFLPDRMKVAITVPEGRRRAGDELAFRVRATHLFGAPAAGRQVEARCEFLAAEFSPPSFAGYRFADSGRKFAPAVEKLGEATLDAGGQSTFTVRIPQGMTPPSAAKALLVASVSELGGRAVAATAEVAVDCWPHYIGLARANKEHARLGASERLLVAAVQPDGAPVPSLRLEGTAYRVVWNTVLKLQGNSYRFVSEREEAAVGPLACTIANGRGEVAFRPPDVGEYTVRLADKASGASADLAFYCAGEGDVPWALEKPSRVELAADQRAYAPGDTARILVKAPFAGTALVTVETDRIHLARVVPMEKNTAEFTFPVTATLGPNAYCAVTVIRRAAPGSPWVVHRAYGAVPVPLDNASRQLKVELTSPDETRPGQPLRVALRVTDASGAGCKAEVALAAVDEGICQLTRFQTPDPWAFFFAKRRLGVETSDVYSLLMPEPEAKKVGTDSAPGGDGGEEYDPRLRNPVSVERVKQVVLWRSGIETGDDGKAEVVLDVPQFTGQLRLMAVAASAREIGAAERPARVRQPLVLQASFPRFLAPGDEFVVPVTVFNNTATGGSVQFTVEATGGLETGSDVPRHASVAHGSEATVAFTVRAPHAPGAASLTIRARLGDESAVETVELPVRPPTTLRFESGSGSVPAGQAGEFTLPGDWLKGTARYWLSFSGLPTLKLASSLRYLLRYPYGCIEQTTSAAFPLLYLGDVAKLAEPSLEGEAIEPLVQAGIDRVFSMQTYAGGFGGWPGYGEAYPWGSVYATHFLVEAAKAGYDVPKDNLEAALSYLGDLLANNRGEEAPPPVKAYACLVLAQAGKPNRSWTLRLHEQREELPAYSRFQLAAALALMKEDKLARDLLRAAALPPVEKRRDTGDLLHSSAREAAILLSVYLDLQEDDPNVPLLVKRLADSMSDGRWGTTQENAFCLLAMGKYARRLSTGKADLRAELTAGGKPLGSVSSAAPVLLKPGDIGGQPIRVATQGAGTLYYYWGAEGIPARETVDERDTSLKVRRRFLSRDGAELDPRQVRQGDIVIVELTVDNGVAVKNLVINDLLPAGFEIENPRLATSDHQGEPEPPEPEVAPPPGADMENAAAPPAATPLLKRPRALNPDRVEMRDDRLILFADLGSPGLWRHRYVVRAVTCGRFKLPALNAFCMYNPEICSIHGAGTIEVLGKR